MDFRLKLRDVFWQKVLCPFLFGKEAEEAHLFTIETLKDMQQLKMLWILRLLYRSPLHRMPTQVLGTIWHNPVGLAAGFDKHAEVIPALEALGFGAVEIGTVTPRPQSGNEKPRLFRNPAMFAVLNRYGFNSHGSEIVARRLYNLHEHPFGKVQIPIGISIGKNKDTPDTDAVKDYLRAYSDFCGVLRPQDWVKINISSPNTPNLRDIFGRLDDFLAEFVEGTRRMPIRMWPPVNGKTHFPGRFVLKIPPDDLTQKDLERVVELCAKHHFAGIEATNTTVDEKIKEKCGWAGQMGGVSGEPLRMLANQKLFEMKDAAKAKGVDLIGVGGISRGHHATQKREENAKVVQCYTGLVFRGPSLIHEILDHWK